MNVEGVTFDEKGLVPAIAQDWRTGEILMVAYMNRQSLQETLETGLMTYWSRERQELWVKGNRSGHLQYVKEFRIDCDGDVLLFKVERKGGACHMGYRSCFYRRWEKSTWVVDQEKVFDPAEVYGS